MGLWLSKLYEFFPKFSGSQRQAKVVMLGLDGAGKTTLLYKLKLSEGITTLPTIGFNVETYSPSKGFTFTIWDVGGKAEIRNLWEHYYQNTEGLIYIVDSNDRERLQEARDELEIILRHEDMKGVPLVVVANKNDLPGAMDTSSVVNGLNLTGMTNRKWMLRGACAITGQGVYESMKDMEFLVKRYNKRLQYKIN